MGKSPSQLGLGWWFGDVEPIALLDNLLSALRFGMAGNRKGVAKEMTTPSWMVMGWSSGLVDEPVSYVAISGSLSLSPNLLKKIRIVADEESVLNQKWEAL